MLGILKPIKSRLSTDQLKAHRQLHCTNCLAMRLNHGRLTTLLLPVEVDFILTLALAAQDKTPDGSTTRCTAMPLMKQAIFSLDECLLQALADFSLFASAAICYDHERDGDGHSLKDRLFRVVGEKAYQSVEARIPLYAQKLGESVPVEDGEDPLRTWLEGHHGQMLPPWCYFIAKLSPNLAQSPQWIRALAIELTHILLLADALDDREKDEKAGKNNPLIHLGEKSGLLALEHSILKAGLLLKRAPHPLADPWRILLEESLRGVYLRRRGNGA